MKKCNTCKIEKPKASFYKHKSYPDGLQCNFALGALKEDTRLFSKAIEYLNKHNKSILSVVNA